MIDIECWRCGKKLGYQEPNASGVEIPCPRCHARNRILPLVLDNRPTFGFMMATTITA